MIRKYLEAVPSIQVHEVHKFNRHLSIGELEANNFRIRIESEDKLDAVSNNVFYNKTSNNNSTLAFKLNCSVLKCKKTRTEFCQKKKSTNESIQSPGKLMKLLRYLLFLHFLKVILKELQKLAIDLTSVGHYGKLQ